jgi:glycerol-3-phosphate dehydrogenase (NAD(P)+)
MAEVVQEVVQSLAGANAAFLSGPSFALEVAREQPTAVAMASHHLESAERAQDLFQSQYFRVYTNPDVTGVELGGSIKNVMAIAAGMASGLGLGHNTLAALITRGLAEMARLGVALGANPLTFSGLAGMGDLILTCTGDLSRNRSVGIALVPRQHPERRARALGVADRGERDPGLRQLARLRPASFQEG